MLSFSLSHLSGDNKGLGSYNLPLPREFKLQSSLSHYRNFSNFSKVKFFSPSVLNHLYFSSPAMSSEIACSLGLWAQIKQSAHLTRRIATVLHQQRKCLLKSLPHPFPHSESFVLFPVLQLTSRNKSRYYHQHT